MPMDKIILRYVNGIELPQGQALFGDNEDDDHDMPDYNQLQGIDLVERQEIEEDRIALIEHIKKVKKENAEAKKALIENRPESPAE